jgi:hypothetical protein
MNDNNQKLTAGGAVKMVISYSVIVVVLAGLAVSCKALFSDSKPVPKKEHDAAYYKPPAGYKDTPEYRKKDAALNACVGLTSNSQDSLDCMKKLGY